MYNGGKKISEHLYFDASGKKTTNVTDIPKNSFMVDPQVIREWLKKADEDFDFAVSILDDSTFYAQICFHFHQAAEKFVEGWVEE